MSTNKIKHIGIFTSGGDSPGMNAALYSIAKSAKVKGIKISGFRKGYEGLIDGDFLTLKSHDLQKLVHLGGTILKTARSKRFMELEGRKKAFQTLKANKIDALIAIGGDGTFKGLLAFSEICDIPFIGIPGTIDNDLAGTDYTLGFDSAVNTAIENIDKIRDTAESHNRVFIVEVMGRDSGYIGIHSGLTVGADAILIPESGKDLIYLLEKIKNYESEDAFLVVVSEGDEIGAELVAAFLHGEEGGRADPPAFGQRGELGDRGHVGIGRAFALHRAVQHFGQAVVGLRAAAPAHRRRAFPELLARGLRAAPAGGREPIAGKRRPMIDTW